MRIWDAIVVGAGPAGCACAYDLAFANKYVLLLDKADFPRMKACAGGLTMKTLRALRYSIDPVMRQNICRLVFEGRNFASIPVQNQKPICIMTVRAELDAYFLAKTIQAGSAFQRIRGIDRIVQEERSVTVATQDAEFHALFLVSADGVNSQVRRMTGDAPWFRKGLAIEANIYRDARNNDLVFDFAPIVSGYGWTFPKCDHVNIGLYCFTASTRANISVVLGCLITSSTALETMQSRTTLSASISASARRNIRLKTIAHFWSEMRVVLLTLLPVKEFMARSLAVRQQRLPFVRISIETSKHRCK